MGEESQKGQVWYGESGSEQIGAGSGMVESRRFGLEDDWLVCSGYLS